ncbi:hypothetical protein DC434_14870 [Microbacterium sp. TPD7012]|nr:hypothetical protein DC434_14870 [Microbacterium sp. TPD7012]
MPRARSPSAPPSRDRASRPRPRHPRRSARAPATRPRRPRRPGCRDRRMPRSARHPESTTPCTRGERAGREPTRSAVRRCGRRGGEKRGNP